MEGDLRKERHVYDIMKRMAMVIGGITLFYSVYAFISGNYRNFVAHGIIYVLVGGIIWGVRTERFPLVAFIASVGMPIMVLVNCLYLGGQNGFDITFFATALTPFLFYEKNRIPFIIFWLNFLMFLGVRIYYFYSGIFSEIVNPTFYFANSAVIFSFLFLIILFFQRALNKHNALHAERNHKLREAKDNLEYKVSERTKELSVKNEELKRLLNDAKSFNHILSHDMKEPVRSMVSFSQLMDKSVKEEKYDNLEDFAGFVERGAKRLDRIIDDVGLLFELEAWEEEPAFFSLSETISNIETILGANISTAGARLDVGRLPSIWGVKGQVELLFSNLMENAIKFRNGMAPEIKIYAREADGYYQVFFEDNGIGIEKEYREMVFEKFKRLQNNLSEPGSGMGLAICKRVMENHKGCITIIEKDQPGTCFRLCFPKREGFCLPE